MATFKLEVPARYAEDFNINVVAPVLVHSLTCESEPVVVDEDALLWEFLADLDMGELERVVERHFVELCK